MKICIVGPSQSGKTTLANIINRITGLKMISGDDYIKEHSTDWAGLETALASDDEYVLEHISATRLMAKFSQTPSLVLFLGIQKASPDLKTKYFQEQESLRQQNLKYFAGDSITDLLPAFLDHFFENRGLPPPITNFVIEVSSRCNLNCSYCYMYAGGYDTSWRQQPPFMSPEIASATARQIVRHARLYPNQKFVTVFHGGEPLLMKVGDFKEIAERFKSEFASMSNIVLSVQTNGTRITDEYLSALDDLGFGVGVSLDGDKTDNNRRLTLAGDASFEASLSGLRKCLAFPFSKGQRVGVLSVINPASDGSAVYRFFRQLGVRAVDFLLCDHNSDTPLQPEVIEGNTRFLISAFDAWLKDPEICSVAFFRSAIAGICNFPQSVDTLSLLLPSTLCVSTSGGWELLGVLRVTEPGAWTTPFNVFEHSVENVIASQQYKGTLRSTYDLSDRCLGCRHLLTCGGGHITHRFKTKNGFKNPSVHCETLLLFLDHVKSRLVDELEMSR